MRCGQGQEWSWCETYQPQHVHMSEMCHKMVWDTSRPSCVKHVKVWPLYRISILHGRILMMWCCLQCSCPNLTWFGSILSPVCLASDFFSKGVDTGKALGASAPLSFPSTFWKRYELWNMWIYSFTQNQSIHTMMHFIDVYNTELYYLKLSKINILYFHCGKQTHCMLSGIALDS